MYGPMCCCHIQHTIMQHIFPIAYAGGTFALYSLMCRAAGFTPYGPAHPEELQDRALAHTVPAYLRFGRWWSLTNRAVGSRLRQLYARSRTAQVC
jgi:hypothetical protein